MSNTPKTEQQEAVSAKPKEAYTPPVIEKFPPMSNVTFGGSNVDPAGAGVLAGG